MEEQKKLMNIKLFQRVRIVAKNHFFSGVFHACCFVSKFVYEISYNRL